VFDVSFQRLVTGSRPLSEVTLLTTFCTGLCLGSFANVLIHRLPRGLPFVRGRSFCPRCRAAITWRDNVPLVSWFLLGGRCRSCRAAISPRYPTVELAVALLAVLTVEGLGVTAEALRTFVFLYVLLVAAVIDAASMMIPHTLTGVGLIVGLALAPAAGADLGRALFGAASGAAVVIVLDLGYRLIRGRAGLGGGDVMLMAVIGAHLGPWSVPAVLGLGAAAGAASVLIRSRGRPDRQARIPFGPFLAAAAVVVLIWGERLWSWYVARVGGLWC
jgi:leader peptidase (prepilin peptidase) / N-methyltransferase